MVTSLGGYKLIIEWIDDSGEGSVFFLGILVNKYRRGNGSIVSL